MKIIYNIAGTYRPAGMERVLANKTTSLVKAGYEVVVITTDQLGREPAFQFESSIRFIDLGVNYEANNGGSFLNKVLHYPFKQILHRVRLAKVLKVEKADIVVSMFCNDASFLPKIKDGSKKVLEIHFSRFKRLQYGRTGLWALADKWRSKNDLKVVQRFDKFIVLTEEDKTYWGNLSNIQVIPNARTFVMDEPATLDDKVIIAVGRYSYQKQLDKLIDAWALVTKECPDWTLRLVGDGEERDFLRKRIADNRLEDRVILGRAESDMVSVYKHASILALSSRYEGLPMVLLEAQAAGLPIVSFACKCGPKDVITDGEDGYIVEEGNESELADKLFVLMRDEELRKSMGKAAFANSDRFSEEKIMKEWIDLFKKLS